jgi:AcrR family transcriptional regulator
MPRSPEDNQQLKDARRTAILRAATRVFAKKGFSDAKISDIASEAGLSHGLVYHYFENKDAVFKAILEDKLEHARSAMEDDDSLPGSALDRMRVSLGRWLDRVRSEPEMSLMITQALVSDALSAEARAMMHAHQREAFESAVERIRLGQKGGEISKHASPEELATTLLCVMRGIAFTSLLHHGTAYVLPSADTVARLLLPNAALDAVASADTRSAARRSARMAGTSKKKKAAPRARAAAPARTVPSSRKASR